MALRRGIGAPSAVESKAQRLKGKPDTDTKLHANLGAVLSEGQATVGMGEYRALRVDQIERDPTQPRDDLPTKEQVLACKARGIEALPADKRGAMEALMGLAKSIKAVGLQQAIVVVNAPLGGEARYRVKVGERRYLAHVYLGQEFIHAIIRPAGSDADADSLHFAQLVENIQREELTLAQRLRGLYRLASYIESTTSLGTLTAEDIEHILGYKKSQSYLYRKIVAEYDEKVVEAIERGDVNKLEDVYTIMQLPVEERPQAIDRAGRGLPAQEVIADTKPRPQTKRKSLGRGKSVVAFGSTPNAQVVRVIVEATAEKLDSTEGLGLESMDWSDFKAVEQVWKQILKGLEKQHG